MKKTVRLVVLGVILSTAAVMSSIAIGQISAGQLETVASVTEIRDSDAYLIKDFNGFVAVYYKDKETPALITDTPSLSLRVYDRELLDTGITVGSREELLRILEDLSS